MTTDSKHNKPIHNNFLERNFSAKAPNERWASDITYIQTVEGWLYLAVYNGFILKKNYWLVYVLTHERITHRCIKNGSF